MKNKTKILGFSYSKNMANFEAFRQSIKLSINLIFLKSWSLASMKNTNILWKLTFFPTWILQFSTKSLRRVFCMSFFFITNYNQLILEWMFLLTTFHFPQKKFKEKLLSRLTILHNGLNSRKKVHIRHYLPQMLK